MNDNLKELKEVLAFGFDGMDAFKLAAEDKEFSISDLKYLFPLYSSARAAIDNIGNPWERFQALNADERFELLQYVKERFDIADEELELLIEDTLTAVGANVQLVKRWTARFKKPETTQDEA